MNVGSELREARLRAGLSQADITARTKIQPVRVELLEASAFDHLPQGIYLDGLVRAYAHEVGLDGDELVARVHREQASTPFDDFASEADDRGPSEPPNATQAADRMLLAESGPEPPTDASSPLMEIEDAADVRYSAPPLHPALDAAARPPRFVPTAPASRSGARFALPLLAFVAAVALGAYLYQRSRPFSGDIATPAVSEENAAKSGTSGGLGAPGAPGAQGADGAQGARAGSGEPATDAPAQGAPAPGARTAPSAPAPRAAAPSAAAPSAAAPEARSPRSAPISSSAPPDAPGARSAPGAPGAPSAPSAPAPDAPSAPNAPSLSGFWTLDTRVESSSLNRFEGLQLRYRIELRQHGTRITGGGIKVFENGQPLPERAQTPITVQGSLVGSRLTLTFTEDGRRRESAGKMILDVLEDGVLRGRFSSSAARSSGIAEARRPEG